MISSSLHITNDNTRDHSDPELYDVIIGNVEEARDPNDPELYDVIIGNVEGARDQAPSTLPMITSYNSGSLGSLAPPHYQ
jgi:hypothetical protein